MDVLGAGWFCCVIVPLRSLSFCVCVCFCTVFLFFFFFSSRRRHTRLQGDWSSDVCSSDLDLLQARDRLRVILVGTQQEQLGLGEDRSQGVRQVVPELPDGVQRVDHLKQRAVEIAKMLIPQVPHRLPQLRLRRGAEDLRGGALRLGVRRAEQHPPAPDPVLGAAYLEANGDELSVESDGGKVVDDRFGRIGCVVACRLSGHADPRAGLRKDKRRSRLRNTAPPAPPEVGEVLEVGGGWGRLVPSGATSPTLPQDRKSTRLNSSHLVISYAVFCLKKKKKIMILLLL